MEVPGVARVAWGGAGFGMSGHMEKGGLQTTPGEVSYRWEGFRRRHASRETFPMTVKLGGCSPPLMWEMYRGATGCRITNCCTSVVRSFRHLPLQ